MLNYSGIISNRKDKIFMAKLLSLTFVLTGLVMMCLCAINGSNLLIWVCICYSTVMAISFMFVNCKQNLTFFYISSCVCVFGLEIFHLFVGGTDGFGILWTVLFPLISIFMMEGYLFLGFNILIPLLPIIAFWTPLNVYMYKGFSIDFRIRLPILLFIEAFFTLLIKYKMTSYEQRRRKTVHELENLKDNLSEQVLERTKQLLEEKEQREKLTLEVTIALAGTIDAKDKYTSGHSYRVAEYTKLLANKLGKDEKYQQEIYLMALLHDIGKIGVPDEIINKPGRLTDEEYDQLKNHPVIGADIVKSISSMPNIGVGVQWHHERWDGNGYPHKLKGYDIPEAARIISVADAYDAMTSNRSYRNVLSQETVRNEFVKGKGTQFDPVIAEAMLKLIDEDSNYEMHA